MGSSDSKFIFVNYYLFQKNIRKNLLNRNTEDKNDINEAFFIHPDWIAQWKKMYNYELMSGLLDKLNIENENLNNQHISVINQYMNQYNINIGLDSTFLINSHNYLPINEIITQKSLENLVDEKTYKKFKINKNTTVENVQYIFKKQMIILFFKKNLTIRLLIHSLNPFKNINNLINLRFLCFDENVYENYKKK